MIDRTSNVVAKDKHHWRLHSRKALVLAVVAGFLFLLAGISFMLMIEAFMESDIALGVYRFLATLAFLIGGGITSHNSHKAWTSAHEVKQTYHRMRQVGVNLYQSGMLREGTTYEELGVDLIFDLSAFVKWHPVPPIGKFYTNWPIADRDLPDQDVLDNMAQALAAWTLKMPVLIKCDLGVNRSGLLVHEVLKWQKELLSKAQDTQRKRVMNTYFQEAIDDLISHSKIDLNIDDMEDDCVETRAVRAEGEVLRRKQGIHDA